MLAHLHANLNFAIYSLSNETFRAAYRRLAVRIVARCCRRTTPRDIVAIAAAAAAAAAVADDNCDASRTPRRTALCTRGVEGNRPLVTVECHQLHVED